MIDISHVLISIVPNFLVIFCRPRATRATACSYRSNMEFGEAVVLAKLPRAGLTGEGQTRFCQVYGIRDAARKKRHEICAAVDGNSLNVFEVRGCHAQTQALY